MSGCIVHESARAIGCKDCDAKHATRTPPRRAHYIGAPEFHLLNLACLPVWEAFRFGYGIYLVGSSLTRRDYRDVDLRCIVSDEDFQRLFPGSGEAVWRHPLWALVCSSISLHLSRASGLPVDFQVQGMTEANRDYPSPEHPRSAVGVFIAACSSPSGGQER